MLIFVNVIMIKVFRSKNVNAFFWLRRKVMEIVGQRNKDQTNRKDYLQLLLDAQTTEKLHDIERNEANYLTVRLDKKLTRDVSRSTTKKFRKIKLVLKYGSCFKGNRAQPDPVHVGRL